MASVGPVIANPVRDILELFGAIDRAVREADDPEVSAAADKLIPGLVAHPGWYAELEGRFFPGDRRREPNLFSALGKISAYDAGENTGRLTPAQKARLLYGISTSERLRTVASSSLPALDNTDAEFDKALVGSLAALAPRDSPNAKDREDKAAEARDAILQQAQRKFLRAADFDTEMRTTAVASSIRDGTPMTAPLCQTAVVMVDGYQSVIVDTKFTSATITLDQLKSVANPFNWDEDYADLFADMKEQNPRRLPDGWRRVLESVNLLGSMQLTTPLKFFPSEPNRLEARLDYDLDKTAVTDTTQVRVDRGFINMKSTSGDPAVGGVRVATRKVVHIQGISAFAQARLVCIGGYGTASADFLLGSAADPPDNPAPFNFPTKEDEADPTEQAPAEQQTQQPARATDTTHFVPAAVDAWTECAQDLTNGYFDVAQKWMTGSLTFNDVADYTARVSGELASSPWKYLQAMTAPRKPGQPGGAR